MSILKKYQDARDKASNLQEKISRAKGSLEHIRKELSEAFKCDDLDQADGLLKTLGEELEEKEKRFSKALAAFEEEYGEQLEESDDA